VVAIGAAFVAIAVALRLSTTSPPPHPTTPLRGGDDRGPPPERVARPSTPEARPVHRSVAEAEVEVRPPQPSPTSTTVDFTCRSADENHPFQIEASSEGSPRSVRSGPGGMALEPGSYEIEVWFDSPSDQFWHMGQSVSLTVDAGQPATIELSAELGGAVSIGRTPNATRQVRAVRGVEQRTMHATRGYRGPEVPASNVLAAGWWEFQALDDAGQILATKTLRVPVGANAYLSFP